MTYQFFNGRIGIQSEGAIVLTSDELTDDMLVTVVSNSPQLTVTTLGALGSHGGSPFLPLIGGTVTGLVSFTGAGTGLAVTNNATIGGTLGVTGLTTITNTTGAFGLLLQASGADATTNYASAKIKTTGATGFGPAFQLDASTQTGGRNWQWVSTGPSDGAGLGAGVLTAFSAGLGNPFYIDAAGGVNGSPFRAGNNSTFTITNGAQPYTNRAFTSAANITGTTDSSYTLNHFVVSADSSQVSGAGQFNSWLDMGGNLGFAPWRPLSVYSLGAVQNNNGRLYRVITAGTSAASGGPTGTTADITDGSVHWTYLQDDWKGNHGGFTAAFNITGSPGDFLAPGGELQLGSGSATTAISTSLGGSAPASGASRGFIYGGFGAQMWAYSGATNLSGVVGSEFDVGIFTGASAAERVGIKVISFGDLRGAERDSAINIGAFGNAPGWKTALSFTGGASPFDATNGAIIRYEPLPTLIPAPSVASEKVQLLTPIDLTGIISVSAHMRTSGGFQVLPAGDISTGSLHVSTSGATVNIDASGGILASVAANASGTGYRVNEYVFDRATGTVLQITAINGSGAPTTYTVSIAGSYIGAAPGTLTLIGANGVGPLTAVPTWTTGTTLALQPSSGNTRVGTGAAIATNATTSMLLIPSCAGAPTGNVGALGQVALIWDSTDAKLYVGVAGTWKGVTLS